MRIGIDCRLWNETGVGRYIRNLVANLQEIDTENDYVLFVLDALYEKIKKETTHNPKWTVVKADFRWHGIEEQVLFPQAIVQQNVDLMHFPYFSVPLLYNKPFVVTIHDVILEYFATGKASTLPYVFYQTKRIAYRYVINHAIKKSKSIIVPLHAVKKDIRKMFHVPENKIAVTYEGAEGYSVKMKNAQIHFEKNYFLHVGNVYPHKNCERLIDAFEKPAKKHPDIKLYFIGKEDYFLQRLKSYVMKKNYQKQIVFLGIVSDEELANYYEHATALVLPSLMEGFGLPALEAMSQSCIVLAADIPSLHEVCQDAAIFFDPLSVEGIANVMEKAIQLPAQEKKDMQKKGMSRCKAFSWRQMAKETLAVYERCSRI